jgi:hypothetical protein
MTRIRAFGLDDLGHGIPVARLRQPSRGRVLTRTASVTPLLAHAEFPALVEEFNLAIDRP